MVAGECCRANSHKLAKAVFQFEIIGYWNRPVADIGPFGKRTLRSGGMKGSVSFLCATPDDRFGRLRDKDDPQKSPKCDYARNAKKMVYELRKFGGLMTVSSCVSKIEAGKTKC